jgi:hypothetical protein
MIILSVEKTTGKQAYKIVCKAIKDRSLAIGKKVHQEEFCLISSLTRTSLIRYRNGDKPGPEGIIKIAAGLKVWGIESRIEP